MDPHVVQLLARFAAIEFLIENIYAMALMQTADPVGEANRWAGEARALARRAEAALGDAENQLSRAVVASMVGELDGMFGRIVQRIEARARAQPVAGNA